MAPAILYSIRSEEMAMARCVYCGQAAGFLRRLHPECHERHQHVVSAIPRFLSAAMGSPISAERFSTLLQAAARVSFVRAEELKSLCVSGFNNIIDSILQERPVSSPELQRITELIDAIEMNFPEGLGLDEKLIKIGIISELYDGKLSDHVVIVGPMPITLGQGEAVLWIFNHVRPYQTAANEMKKSLPTHYYNPEMLEKKHPPTETLGETVQGDLLLTNRNIYFVQSENSSIRIPISRITSLQPYTEGLDVGWKSGEPQSRIFLLDDPWFAANIIGRLFQLTRK